MKLGELLVQSRRVSVEQLRAALDAQAIYGGRLGTSLVQLGFLDVDAIGRALGEQQGRTAAQRRHIAAIDKRVVSLFPPRVVTSHRAVPLGYTPTKPQRVVIACVDPAMVPVEEFAFAAGTRIDLWVAPELLVQECLERYFGAPAARGPYVDVKFTPQAGVSRPPDGDHLELAELSVPMAGRIPSSPPSGRGSGSPSLRPVSTSPSSKVPSARRPHLTPPPPPLESPVPPSLVPYAPSSAPPSQRAPLSQREPRVLEPPPLPSPLTPLTPSEPPQSARLSLTELPAAEPWDSSQPRSSRPPAPLPEPTRRAKIDLAEASRRLTLATSKEAIGGAMEDWLRSTFGCGLVLIVKNDLAVGWRGYFPGAEDLIEAVAVPLAKPSLFSEAFEKRAPFCGMPPAEGAKLDGLFWKVLRCAPPLEIVVVPVVLANRTVNLVYAHALDDEPLSDTVFRETQVLAGNAGAAYTRLIREERAKLRS